MKPLRIIHGTDVKTRHSVELKRSLEGTRPTGDSLLFNLLQLLASAWISGVFSLGSKITLIACDCRRSQGARNASA
jgi:hypothetical protein